jgi:transcriptional regulator with XRE-family HTH domain
MKKEQTITAILGITQQDVAMLLGVNRSQWSMFESGKRDLPLAAKQLLAEMLTYVQAPETTAKSTIPLLAQATLPQLERLLRENEYQQLLTARRIAAATKKQEAQLRVLKLAEFLSTRDHGKQAINPLPDVIARKVSCVTASPVANLLVAQQLKQEMLELEKLLLESRLRKLSNYTQ